jgi:hypothetical protein
MELGRHDARGTVLWHQVLESLRIARLTVIIKKCLPKTGKLEYPQARCPTCNNGGRLWRGCDVFMCSSHFKSIVSIACAGLKQLLEHKACKAQLQLTDPPPTVF